MLNVYRDRNTGFKGFGVGNQTRVDFIEIANYELASINVN
jgi:hypothetical protein